MVTYRMRLMKLAPFQKTTTQIFKKKFSSSLVRSFGNSHPNLLQPLCLIVVILFIFFFPSALFAKDDFPFSTREQMEYLVKWDPPAWMFFFPNITAGKMKFVVVDRTLVEGIPLHHFQGSAISTSSLVKVNDAFESTSRGADLCAATMIKRTHEGKRHREFEISVDNEKKTATVIERDLAIHPPKTLKTESITDFPQCATDLLAAIYRVRKFPMQDGGVYRFLLTDNGRTKEVTLKTIKKEQVKNDAGLFSTQKVEVQSFFGGLFKQRGSFYIWFTEDERHLPVKFEMKVKLGKVHGNLVKVQE